jgi:hypothetical protein
MKSVESMQSSGNIANALLPAVEFPEGFFVRHDRAYKFKDLAVAEGCSYVNIIDWSNELIEVWLMVPDDKKELVTEMAFMTHISNPEFQKYYK